MSSMQKRGLGKGLGALIPQGNVLLGGRTIVNIDINNIVPNPRQPRTVFSKERLAELAASIKEQGIIEPILTRMKSGKYELIAGERRFRAAKLAGLATVPSIVKSFTDEQAMEISLIENLQREDLNPMDEAEGYSRLIEEFKLTQERIAQRVGKNRTTIANMLRLLSLPDPIKEALRQRKISGGHARALLAISDPNQQLATFRQILENRLNVRDVESVAETSRPAGQKSRRKPPTQNVQLAHLVEKLTTHLGTKVKIYGTKEKGRIEINYFSQEDLERVLELIGCQARV